MPTTYGIVPEIKPKRSKLVWNDAGDSFTCDSLYFILDEASGAIKIGRGNPAKRLTTLQIGNPNPLRLVADIPNAGWQEAFWHCCWEMFRIRGEWYQWDADVQAAVEAAQRGEDWTDHVPPLIALEDGEVDEGEWREHMLDALDAYSDFAHEEVPRMALTRAAEYAVYDPDFDGRCVLTRHNEALNALYPTPVSTTQLSEDASARP